MVQNDLEMVQNDPLGYLEGQLILLECFQSEKTDESAFFGQDLT